MFENFKNHIDKNFPFLIKSKLLIAISGGIDSVVLTHLLHQLNFDIQLAHCNFQLREKESDLDELFIKNLGTELSIPIFTTQFETIKYSKENKLSTQLAARKLRYDWFHELIKKHQFDYVLTAHHADDNLETFLINLSRGTGLDGLTGIPVIKGNIARPLLSFSQKEIEIYADKNQIEWREDASNQETKYLRNKIRHQIIPLLKEVNPNLLKTHHKTADFLKQSQQIIADKIQEVSAKVISKEGNLIKINIPELLKLSDPKIYLYQLLKKYRFSEWNDVYTLIYAQSGKRVISNSHTLLKDRDFLLLLPTPKIQNYENESYRINKGESKITKPINLLLRKTSQKPNIDTNCIFVDNFLLNYPLVIRKWKAGDFFYPTGMLGKKKVSKYFKDAKLSVFDKKNTWLLCDNNNNVIWIIGKRQDKRFLPLKNKNEIIKITKLNNPL